MAEAVRTGKKKNGRDRKNPRAHEAWQKAKKVGRYTQTSVFNEETGEFVGWLRARIS